MKKKKSNIFKTSNLIWYIIFIGFFIFNKGVTRLLDSTLVKYVFQYASSSYLIDLLVLFIAVYIFFIYYWMDTKYIPSKKNLIIICFTVTFYSYYRFITQPWTFIPFSFIDSIKYFDIIILSFIIGNSILELRYRLKDKPNKIDESKNAFFNDIPINCDSDDFQDALGYHKYAEQLAENINNSNFKKSFAIGINGFWGSGKTSFINLLRKNLNQEVLIIVDFNPWDSENPNAIITDFFETLQEKIRRYNFSLARKLIQYSNRLIKINHGSFASSLNAISSIIFGFDSLNSLKEKINDSLTKIGLKLIVVIDDLDRLDSNEIQEVLRLIRNTADFHNTIFIVAYDRKYVINAIQEMNIHKPELYLEKIFQIETSLPYFNKSILKEKLLEFLKPKFDGEFKIEIEEAIQGKAFVRMYSIESWLNSMRDVTRLANSIVLNLKKLQGEVVFIEFIQLEILRLKYRNVYELLFRRQNDFLSFEAKNGKNVYGLMKTNKKDNSDNKIKFKIEEELILDEYQLNKIEIDKVVGLIDNIFENVSTVHYGRIHHLSIIYPSNFERYFAYNLLQGDLSEVEFSNARRNNLDTFKFKIDEWVAKGFQDLLRSRFEEISKFDDRDDFEKVIKAIFYLANKKYIDKDSKEYFVYFDPNNLADKLKNYDGSIYKNYYTNDKNGYKEYKEFFMDLFNDAKVPYEFESSLMMSWLSGLWHDGLPISQLEGEEILCSFLERYGQSISKYDNTFRDLCLKCKTTIKGLNLGNSFSLKTIFIDRAKTIFIDFITKKDLDGFIKYEIVCMNINDTIGIFQLYPDLIWKDWKSFKEFVDNLQDEKSKYLKEFKEIVNLQDATPSTTYLSFDLKDIPNPCINKFKS